MLAVMVLPHCLQQDREEEVGEKEGELFLPDLSPEVSPPR